jgi:peptidylprolyl isomerase
MLDKVSNMPHKLKSTARKSRRNRKIGIVVGVALLAIIIGLGLFYLFGQPVTRYGLLVGVGGSGSTNVTGTHTYDAGTRVAVQATPDSGMILKEWLLNDTSVGSVNPYVVTMSENRNLTAVFAVPIDQGKVLLQTSMGEITIELRDDMPITSGNFKNLVTTGIYDGASFYRVINDTTPHMIQGGLADSSVPTIQDEFTSDNRNDRGTIAMANAGANTGSSEFFINTGNNNYLDSAHPVFGRVIAGMDVVDAISNVPRDANDKPLTDIKIIKAEILP